MNVLAVSAILVVVLAAFPCAGWAAHEGGQEERPGSITVTGSASDEFPPDTVTFTIAVENRGATVEEVTRYNGESTERVTAAVRKLLDTAGGDSVRTSTFAVNPVYEYNEKARKNLLTGYRAFNQMTVKSRHLDRGGAIISAATASGATNVGDLRFVLGDDRHACGELVVKAVERGKKEAELVARALGATIAGIRHAAPSCRSEQPPPVFRGMERAELRTAASPPPVPIEAGPLTVSASVVREFVLEK